MTIIEQRLSEILRAEVKSVAGRTISPDEPLQVAGLDSLSILNFLTSVEKQFEVQLPDQLWAEKDGLTLAQFAMYLSKNAQSIEARSEMESAQTLMTPSKQISGVRKSVRKIYARESFVLLAVDLHTANHQTWQPPKHLLLREGTLEDLPVLKGFWPAHKQAHKELRYRQRLDAGFLALTAWKGNEIVGIDWISDKGDFEPNTGLQIRTSPGTAYGFDLYEKYEGMGIGFSLLIWAIQECRRRGYDKQVTLVSANNVRMLTVAKKLAGYSESGQVVTRKYFGRPRSVWKVPGRSSRAGEILVQLGIQLIVNWSDPVSDFLQG
jgi:GNAT superfamily N-acetyltransferase/acyl carrier protein